jgi:hypothetical protein
MTTQSHHLLALNVIRDHPLFKGLRGYGDSLLNSGVTVTGLR